MFIARFPLERVGHLTVNARGSCQGRAWFLVVTHFLGELARVGRGVCLCSAEWMQKSFLALLSSHTVWTGVKTLPTLMALAMTFWA